MAEIIPLSDERLRKVLAYPTSDDAVYARAVKELGAMGVEGIISAGNLDLGGFKVLGKGCVGIVLAGVLKGQTVALKVLRTDANRASLMGEGRLLSMANGCHAGPRLIAAGVNALAMEYINGSRLPQWLEPLRPIGDVRVTVSDLLGQCYRLDACGLDHGELSDARKHVLVDSEGIPHLLDFETASIRRQCRNLVSMVSYLFFKDSMSALVGRYLSWDRAELVKLIKGYKEAPSEAGFKEMLRLLGL